MPPWTYILLHELNYPFCRIKKNDCLHSLPDSYFEHKVSHSTAWSPCYAAVMGFSAQLKGTLAVLVLVIRSITTIFLDRWIQLSSELHGILKEMRGHYQVRVNQHSLEYDTSCFRHFDKSSSFKPYRKMSGCFVLVLYEGYSKWQSLHKAQMAATGLGHWIPWILQINISVGLSNCWPWLEAAPPD